MAAHAEAGYGSSGGGGLGSVEGVDSGEKLGCDVGFVAVGGVDRAVEVP